MESDYFSLEVNKNNKLTRIFQLVLGIICAVIAFIWLILNIKTLKTNGALVLTIIFLLGFAYYQVISGLGLGEKFIDISKTSVRLKKNSILPANELKAADIEKVEIFPLNVVFFQRSGKKVLLRFGTTYIDLIEPLRKRIKSFCEVNNIPFEFKSEVL
jgi:hypothetical protein